MKRLSCTAIALLALASFAALAANQSISIAPGDTITITSPAIGAGPAPPPVVVPPSPPPVVVPPNVKILQKPWDNGYVYTRDAGGFGAGDVIAVRFTTGSIRSSSTDLPHIVAAQWQSPPYDRIACLADQPGRCPDNGGTLNGKPIPPLSTSIGQTPTFSFSLGVDNFWGYPRLELNTTYYMNIKIVPPGDPFQSYDMSVNIVKGAL